MKKTIELWGLDPNSPMHILITTELVNIFGCLQKQECLGQLYLIMYLALLAELARPILTHYGAYNQISCKDL